MSPFVTRSTPLLETGHADARRGRRHHKHRRRHGQRIAEHAAECRADGGGIEADERAGRHAREVDEHPARDRRVEHHEDDVAEETRDAVQPPHLGLLRRQRRMEAHDRPLGGASGGELHEENRQADQRERDEVKYDEPTAAVLPGDVGEAPDVAEANRAPGGQENEAQAARQSLSHDVLSNEVGRCPGLACGDIRLEALRHPREVASEKPHRLHALRILRDLFQRPHGVSVRAGASIDKQCFHLFSSFVLAFNWTMGYHYTKWQDPPAAAGTREGPNARKRAATRLFRLLGSFSQTGNRRATHKLPIIAVK